MRQKRVNKHQKQPKCKVLKRMRQRNFQKMEDLLNIVWLNIKEERGQFSLKISKKGSEKRQTPPPPFVKVFNKILHFLAVQTRV